MKELDQDYAQAGLAGHLDWGERPALIVIDFCLAYLDPASPLYAGVESARDSAARLLTAARVARIPVLHSQPSLMRGGANGGVFYRKVPAMRILEQGSPLIAFPPELAPLPDEIIIAKQYASAFAGTSLAATLTALRVDTLIIAGVSTSGCVRATTVDACQSGFIPFVCRDAVGDRDPRPHEANLFDLQAKYAEVVSEDFVREKLRGRNT